MTAATVSRQDISVVEEIGDELTLTTIPRFWIATLDGRLSTHEHVEMTREGTTFAAAVDNLAAAIAEQGWEIR